MLPPIQISQNSVAYQVRRTDGFDTGKTGPTPPATAVSPEQSGLDIRSAIAGRVSILLLSGPERTTESFTIMAELFGRSLGIARRENETQASYMRRLAEALHALPQAKRQIVEQQLSQLFNALALKTVIGAFADPSGPDAAIMTMHLEIAEDGDGQMPTRFAFASYQPDGEDSNAPGHSVRPSPLVPARTDIGSMHLRIVTSSDHFDVQHASASEHPVTPASRPSIDIRGPSDNAELARATAEFPDAAPDRPGRTPQRTATQVTIDISGRARVDGAPPSPMTQSRRLTLDKEWQAASRDPTSKEPSEMGATAKAPIVEQRSAEARNAADTQDSARMRMEVIAAGHSQPTATPSPAIRIENDAEDAIGKFLRASLAASYLPAQSDSEEQQAWRERETILSDRLDLVSTDVTGEQRPESLAETSSTAEHMESATRPAPSEPQILPRPEAGQALIFREPIGFPAVGYPYADEEETGRRSDRHPQEDDERWREDEGDGSAGQQDMSGQQQGDETEPSPDEAASASASASDDEPAIMPPQRGISDSANDLYWKMAGWA